MIVNSISLNKINLFTPPKNNGELNCSNTATVPFSDNNKYYNIPFLGLSPRVLSAKTYLSSVKPAGGFDTFGTDIYKLDLNKLDGIQDGIKVFDGLNIKEIAFISRLLGLVNTMRGCYNKCSHCYANAQAPIEEKGEYINKMCWDDFKSLTAGFKELHDRLGFHIAAPEIEEIPQDCMRYLTSFHDSDSIDIILKDNECKEHDLIEIMDKLSDSTGIKSLFDTTGWTVANSKLQQRAEKYAKYYSNPENSDKVYLFNISLNPFHALMTRSVMEKRAGNIEQAKKFREIYTDRIANAIYTFTPILNVGKLDFVVRAFHKDFIGKEGEGFTMENLKKLINDILTKVEKKYVKDLKGSKRYVKTYSEINSNMKEIKELINNQLSYSVTLFEEGRSLETFGKDNQYAMYTKTLIGNDDECVRLFSSALDYLNPNSSGNFRGIIDANGKFYLTSFHSTYPTELQLNFANKNKKTASIKPALQNDLVVRKSVINNV